MAAKLKVEITLTNGQKIEKTIKPSEEEYYDNLPFTQSNVAMTKITRS